MKKKILLVFLMIFISLPSFSFAQRLCYDMASYNAGNNSTPQTPLFDIRIFDGGQKAGCFTIATKGDLEFTNYQKGIQFLFDLAVGICIALAVILFTYGAVQGIVGDVFSREWGPLKKEQANTTMTNAIVGLLVVLSAYMVIKTVNPDLVNLPALQGLYNLQTSSGSTGGPSGVTGRSGFASPAQ